MLGALVPIFSLKEEMVRMAKKIREEGSSPWSSLDDGPNSLLQWIEDLCYDFNHTVFRGAKDVVTLGAAGFNDQVKGIRKMLSDHPRCKRLSVNIDKCPPSETHFCGDRTEFLKNQMEASKLTDPVKLYAVSTANRFDYARSTYTARGKGLKGKTPYSGGKSAYRRPASRPASKNSFEDSRPSTSKASGNAFTRPSRGGRGAKRY